VLFRITYKTTLANSRPHGAEPRIRAHAHGAHVPIHLASPAPKPTIEANPEAVENQLPPLRSGKARHRPGVLFSNGEPHHPLRGFLPLGGYPLESKDFGSGLPPGDRLALELQARSSDYPWRWLWYRTWRQLFYFTADRNRHRVERSSDFPEVIE